MKFIILELVFAALTAGVGFAQTQPNVANMKGPAVTAISAILIQPNGKLSFAIIDAGTFSIVNGVLTAAQKAATLPVRVVEITQVAVATPTYTLGATPNAAPELDIFWNGICLSAGVDYSLAANVVTFIGPEPVAGDVLRVVYRSQ